jgi:hypothetical protein
VSKLITQSITIKQLAVCFFALGYCRQWDKDIYCAVGLMSALVGAVRLTGVVTRSATHLSASSNLCREDPPLVQCDQNVSACKPVGRGDGVPN